MRHGGSDATVTVVTSARLSHSEDIALRQRRYILTQSVRVLCVVLATTLPIPLIWKGVFMLGAIALPWFGVVMANAGPTVSRRKRHAIDQTPTPQPLRMAIEGDRVIEAER